MVKENKLNGLVLMDKKKLAQTLGDLKKSYSCKVCGHDYPETDLIIDKDDQELICKNCAVLKEILDAEQEEADTLIREEKKMKAGLYEKEGV